MSQSACNAHFQPCVCREHLSISLRRDSCKLFSECHFSQNRFLPLGLQNKHLNAGGVINTMRHLTVPSSYYGCPDWRAAAFCLSPCVVGNCVMFAALFPVCTTIIDCAALIESENCALPFFPSESLILKEIAFFLLKFLWCRYLIT